MVLPLKPPFVKGVGVPGGAYIPLWRGGAQLIQRLCVVGEHKDSRRCVRAPFGSHKFDRVSTVDWTVVRFSYLFNDRVC